MALLDAPYHFPLSFALFFLFFFFLFIVSVHTHTDSPDVSALNVMYTSLNSPSKLTGWKSSGGDPCEEDWEGITCSGSSVTEIRLSGYGLSGSMGYQLSSLTSVTYFDLSKNKLQGEIPYQLPPNAVQINLAGNGFTGSVPYSISQMTDLEVLNLAKNQLNGQLSDMFMKLSSLTLLDLSSNHLTGDLPQSFGKLANLKTLHLQNNKFTGSILILSKLSLEDLNIENNHFSGWIPDKLKEIDNLKTHGNSWSSGPAPPQFSKQNDIEIDSNEGKGLSMGVILGIFLALLVVVVFLSAIFSKKRSQTSSSIYLDEESIGQKRSFTPLVSHEFQELKSVDSSTSINMMASQTAPVSSLKTPPSDWQISFNENGFLSKQNSRTSTDQVNMTTYSSTELLTVTANFGASRLLGEGSIGRVYKAKFSDGKIMVVKKLSSTHLGLCNSEDFLELVLGISRLRHPNITSLVGYCSETGYPLLVYEYVKNGSLHDFLHLSDEYSKPLTWDTRVRIALGTARAVEYLHEVCSPSIIHKNIKSANVLLDPDLNPHLSDCGFNVFYDDTAKTLGPGYNPPESNNSSAYTLKSDVYSFGVVMLELLTGCMPFDNSKQWSDQCLVRWATPQLHDIDALSKMVDPALRGLYPPKALSRFADIIALCVQSEPEFRPPMSEVVQALVRCIQRPSFTKRGDLSASRRSDDSDGYY